MKPTIYAKSALKPEHIEHKISLGCNGIEIQLLKELIEDKSIVPFDSVFNSSSLIKYPIKIVHTPLRFNEISLSLEFFLCNPKYLLLLNDICRFANSCSKNGEKIGVIIHCYERLEYLEETGLFFTICKNIDELLSMYPNIEILIENSVLINKKLNKSLFMVNGCCDIHNIVKKIRKTLNTDRVGSVLDICHANISSNLLNLLWNHTYVEDNPKISLYEFIKEHKDVCKLIHLASYRGYGFNKDHGIPFSDTDKEECFKVLDLYHKFNYTCPITLEVSETDYLNCQGYKKTKEIVEEYYSK